VYAQQQWVVAAISRQDLGCALCRRLFLGGCAGSLTMAAATERDAVISERLAATVALTQLVRLDLVYLRQHLGSLLHASHSACALIASRLRWRCRDGACPSCVVRAAGRTPPLCSFWVESQHRDAMALCSLGCRTSLACRAVLTRQQPGLSPCALCYSPHILLQHPH
jgi:hypothetical protein